MILLSPILLQILYVNRSKLLLYCTEQTHVDTDLETTTFLQLSTLAKENIQARDRSSRILAGVASAVNGAFTCNGNKTEFTVGYATMYGDLAGSLPQREMHGNGCVMLSLAI